jgi:hypothetical protein
VKRRLIYFWNNRSETMPTADIMNAVHGFAPERGL